MQVRRADQSLYHHELTVSSLGSVCQSCTAPLANLKCDNMKSRPKRGAEYRKSNRLEVLHLFRWFTHTHTICKHGAFASQGSPTASPPQHHPAVSLPAFDGGPSKAQTAHHDPIDRSSGLKIEDFTRFRHHPWGYLTNMVVQNYGSPKRPLRHAFTTVSRPSRPSRIGTGNYDHVFVRIFRNRVVFTLFAKPFAALSRPFAIEVKTHVYISRCHSDTLGY